MLFIQGNNRHQTYFSTLEDQVSADNSVRLMDAFMDKLNLQKSGFTGTFVKAKGATAETRLPSTRLLQILLLAACALSIGQSQELICDFRS